MVTLICTRHIVIIIMQLFSAIVYQPSYSTTHFFIIRKSGFKKLMVFQAKYGNIVWSYIQYKFILLEYNLWHFRSSGVNMTRSLLMHLIQPSLHVLNLKVPLKVKIIILIGFSTETIFYKKVEIFEIGSWFPG